MVPLFSVITSTCVCNFLNIFSSLFWKLKSISNVVFLILFPVNAFYNIESDFPGMYTLGLTVVSCRLCIIQSSNDKMGAKVKGQI